MASNIVEHELRHKEILQSSFDLLGELIKFNVEAFRTFEEILHTQPQVSMQIKCCLVKEDLYLYLPVFIRHKTDIGWNFEKLKWRLFENDEMLNTYSMKLLWLSLQWTIKQEKYIVKFCKI